MFPACYLPHWQEPFTTAQPDMQHRASSGDMHVPSHSTPPHQLPFLEHIPARQHLPSSYGMQLPLHSTPHDRSERVHPPKSSHDPAEQSTVVTKKTKAKLITRNNVCINLLFWGIWAHHACMHSSGLMVLHQHLPLICSDRNHRASPERLIIPSIVFGFGRSDRQKHAVGGVNGKKSHRSLNRWPSRMKIVFPSTRISPSSLILLKMRESVSELVPSRLANCPLGMSRTTRSWRCCSSIR